MTSEQRFKLRYNLVLLRIVPASILAMLVVCLVVSLITKDLLRNQAHDRLRHQSESLATTIQIKIDTLQDAARALATNQLLVNGLIDTLGRDNYLPAFFRSLRLPGPSGATISLVDYRGRTIQSTKRTLSYEAASWISKVTLGQEHFSLSRNGILMAVPVKYAGLTEGIVVVQYPGEKVDEFLKSSSTDRPMAILDGNGLVLHTTVPMFADVGQPIPTNESTDWILARARLAGYSQLSVATVVATDQVYSVLLGSNRLLLYAIALDLLALAAGIVYTRRKVTKPVSLTEWWLPATIGIGMVVTTGVLWVTQDIQERRHIQNILASENRSIALSIQAHLNYRVGALQRMSDRWSTFGKPERSLWIRDAVNFVDDFGDFQALEWVDASYHVRWIVPFDGNEMAQDLDLGFEPHRRAALELAKESAKVTMTTPINLVQGGKGFLIYCPIFHDQMFEGFILGVLRFDKLFANLDGHIGHSGYQKQIQVGQDLVFDSSFDGQGGHSRQNAPYYTSLNLYGVTWTIGISASDQAFSKIGSSLKDLTLIVGASIGALLVFMTCLSQVLRQRTVETARVNELLKSEVYERRHAEELLQKSDKRFELAIRGTSDGLWDWNIVTNEVWYAPRFKEMLGYQDVEFPNRFASFETHLHPEDKQATLDAIFKHLEKHIPYDIECRIKNKHGKYLWFRTRGIAEFSDDGNPLRMAGSIQDIDDQKRAQDEISRYAGDLWNAREAIRINQQRFELAVEGTSDGLWDWVNVQKDTQWWSPRFYELLGYNNDEIEASTAQLKTLLHPDDVSQTSEAMRCHFEQDKPFEVDCRLKTKQGHYRWFRRRGKITRNKSGRPLRMAGSLQDITERKEAEQELARRAEELEQSNRELDDFAYIASHDLKEPLRGIHNYATFLIEDYQDKIDENGVNKLHTLQRLSQRMENLIDTLLHFSRVGRVDMANQETDLNEVLADVIETLHVTLNESGIDIRTPNPLPIIYCDRARIGEVFRNLITNAMKYNDKPKKWIEVSVEDNAPQDNLLKTNSNKQIVDNRYVFYVQDNGIGIPEKHIDSIFRIFKRLHGKNKFGGGTGAGLTIVKKIVERHGGNVWVESTHGQGSTFKFTLGEAA